MIITKEDINQREEFFNDLQSIIEREIKWIYWDLSYESKQNRFDDLNVYEYNLVVSIDLEEESTNNPLYPRNESIKIYYALDSYNEDDPFSDCSINAYDHDFGALLARIDKDKVMSAFTDYVDNMISYQDENFINHFDNLITE